MCLKLILTLTLTAAISMTVSESFAQAASDNIDPMTHVKSLHTGKISLDKGLTQNRSVANSDFFTHNYGSGTAAPAQIAAELTQKFGVPKTGRGDLKVWEVKNAQGHTVTIMIGSNKAGQQELIVDQRRPLKQTKRLLKSSNATIKAPRRAQRTKRVSQERD